MPVVLPLGDGRTPGDVHGRLLTRGDVGWKIDAVRAATSTHLARTL